MRERVPLPFDLPRLSRGFAALGAAACAAGERVASAAAGALSPLVGREVAVRARPVPGLPAPRLGAARAVVDLTALPDAAVLEIDAALVVALVDALAGGRGEAAPATALTPVEASALELFLLAALEGVGSVREVEEALAPRLSRGDSEPASALAIELEITAGSAAGHGRLLLPPAAVRALDAPDGGARRRGGALAIPLSLRSGQAPLSAEERSALAPGDVVLLDPAPAALVVPGGARLVGALEDDGFHVKEVDMTTRAAELPLTVEVELARVEVCLSDLARLDAGAVLPLAIDRRGSVTLRVGESAIGRGELVDVDGAIGVRILALEVSP